MKINIIKIINYKYFARAKCQVPSANVCLLRLCDTLCATFFPENPKSHHSSTIMIKCTYSIIFQSV
jgi:hypothetical protein